MNPREALARDGEHSERVVPAEVVLDGERKANDVRQRPEIVRMNAPGVEPLLVVGNIGVGVVQHAAEAGGGACINSHPGRRT